MSTHAKLPHFTDLLPAHGTMPQLEFAADIARAESANTRIIPVLQEDGELAMPTSPLTSAEVYRQLESLGATGKLGEITKLVSDGVLFVAVGVGEDGLDETALRRAMGAAARGLKDSTNAVVLGSYGIRATVEGLLLGGYAYNGLKSAEKATPDTAEGEKTAEVEGYSDTPARRPLVTVIGDEADRDQFDAAVTVANAVVLARDLVNTPSNLLYPANYADIATAVAGRCGLTVEVLDHDQLREQGFGGITAVGQGSERPPRLVHLSWAPENAGTSVALVGKGITFDTGGISIKPAAGMEQMVMDMGGSAAVLAATSAIAALELPVRVDAWLPLAENMPSGTAQRPGDVITHYGGMTSEVINTDAEGRLVLADAIARASEDHPDYLIETSTLTGAQMVALGKRTFGVMGSDELRDQIAETAREIDEPGWAMPMLEEHDEEIASKVADIKNANSDRFGGMEFAATYLSKFVGETADGEEIPWAHIDVASPAWNTGGPYGFIPARATGVPVRTIVETIRSICS
ncbi:leucyl aminopeptidase [Corynebacterium sp. CCUG 71335]|uniref:leucyl aminopeptidase n=1 Tax=unclassified Corynebacterium TaxID=2624378 RepID=UPI00210DAE4C|nr:MULTISPECIES: leucyl aminopeptidase [unclassified Corynebacterium]MCQ4620739.1 leucyl aminopeptidase [Corynebacterium sp. CCUG 71335]MCQ4622703.1 leucyl aminopeptidase [Corynebacterium sp. CCUG 70398]